MSPSREKSAAIAAAGTAAAAAAGLGIRHLRQADAAEYDSATYRLEPGEPVGTGIRRIVQARVDDAIEQLRGDAASEPAEAIHEARKDIKKVRSGLRLVRDELGDETWRRENDHYRGAARRLSRFRDSEILVEALEGIWDRLGPDRHAFARLRRQLADENAAVRADGSAEEAMTLAAAELVAARPRLDELDLGEGWKRIEPGLRRSYRRGRKRLATVEEEPSTANLHELRKRVKDLWYQLRLIGSADEELIGGLADQAHDLSAHLGDDHDLALLADEVRRRPQAFLAAEDQRALLEEIGRRRDELQFAALSLARRIYSEKPKRFTRSLKKRWDVWRDREPVAA